MARGAVQFALNIAFFFSSIHLYLQGNWPDGEIARSLRKYIQRPALYYPGLTVMGFAGITGELFSLQNDQTWNFGNTDARPAGKPSIGGDFKG